MEVLARPTSPMVPRWQLCVEGMSATVLEQATHPDTKPEAVEANNHRYGLFPLHRRSARSSMWATVCVNLRLATGRLR